MFGYTPGQIGLIVVILAIGGFFSYQYLHFRWLVWRGRKISEKHRADEADQLKKEIDALRPEYPNYSDQALEKMVRANRLRTVVDSLRQRSERAKGTVIGEPDSSKTIMRFSGGFDRPLTVHSIRPDRSRFTNDHRSPLTDVALAALLSSHQCEETPKVENEGKGKGNDTTTGNDSSARASGHRSDCDGSSGTKEGWVSERLQGGSGWGSSTVNRGSSRSDSDSRDYSSESSVSSSQTDD